MELLSKVIDVHGLKVRFRRVGARANIRFATTHAAESDPGEKALLMMEYVASSVHSIEGVTEGGEPVPFPVDAAARLDFVEMLGDEFVAALYVAQSTAFAPDDATLGK